MVLDGAKLEIDNNWKTSSNGTVVVTGPDLTGVSEVWSRIPGDIRPSGDLCRRRDVEKCQLFVERDGMTV